MRLLWFFPQQILTQVAQCLAPLQKQPDMYNDTDTLGKQYAAQLVWPCSGTTALVQECILLLLPVLTASIFGQTFAVAFVATALLAYLSCLATQGLQVSSEGSSAGSLSSKDTRQTFCHIVRERLALSWTHIHASPQPCVLSCCHCKGAV